MPIAAPDTTLAAIQKKVRRLTRSPSTAQLSDDDLNQYINTFICYDFPEHLRTFNLRTTFDFYTNPFQDEYPTDKASYAGATDNILYDFQNKYISTHPPAYIAGMQVLWSQSEEQFFGIYPKINSVQATGNTGDGVTLSFSGTITTNSGPISNLQQQNAGLLQNQVLFESIAINGLGVQLVDIPIVNPTTGQKVSVGNLFDPNSSAYQTALLSPPTVLDATNFIDYETGDYAITFLTAPDSGVPINAQVVFTALSQPRAIMYYANKFVIRPVPDQVYRVTFEVYKRPTQFLETSEEPALQEYWQYIAYGAAKKIFEDRLDMDSVAMIMPEFRVQQNLVNRRTIVQNTNERTASIYSDQTGLYSGWNNFGNSNN